MSQTTLDDDELFTEAANEMRADVQESLDAAREALPDGDAIWETEADNVLGVLNGLRSSLDTGDAADHLRDAKKTFLMGQKADAFEDADDLEEAIEDLEDLVATIEDAHESVGDLAATVPELRSQLDEAHEADDGDEDEDDD